MRGTRHGDDDRDVASREPPVFTWDQVLGPGLQLLAKYGLGTLLAVWLTWTITGNVTKNLEQQSTDMRAVLAVSTQTRADMVQHIAQMEHAGRILIQICVNGAKNDQDRRECLR